MTRVMLTWHGMADTLLASPLLLRTQRQAMIDECKALKVRLGDELPPPPPSVSKVGKGAAKPGARGAARR